MIEFKRLYQRVLILSLILLLCISFPQKQSAQTMEYKIGPQDQLQISVMGVPEINKKLLRVTEDGKITLPLIGEVTVEGMSSTQLEKGTGPAFRREKFPPKSSGECIY